MACLHVTVLPDQTLTLLLEEDDGTRRELPVEAYTTFSTSFLAGDRQEFLFELWYSDREEPDDPHHGLYATVLLQCVRSAVETVVYRNEMTDPLWVRNGAEQPSSPRIDPGQTRMHLFRPDPPLPPWQVPSTPEQEQWEEQTAAEMAGMHITPEEKAAAIPWDRVETYCTRNGYVFWFERALWDNLRFLTIDCIRERCSGLPPRLPAAELHRLRTLTFARQGRQHADTAFRRPTVWMRGRTITPEQAMEVLRRCESYFQPRAAPGEQAVRPPDAVHTQLLTSRLFMGGVSWCHPDGHIGWDGICPIKNPFEEEILEDGCLLMEAFPFLDLFFLFWACEETEPFTPGQMALHGMPLPEFGVRFHQNRVEICSPRTAWETFCDFQARYGEAPESYEEGELLRRGSEGLDRAYLDRCLRANAMDPAGWTWEPRPAVEGPADEFLALRYETLRQACARRGRTWPKYGENDPKEI